MPICHKCQSLENRAKSLSKRISKYRPWDVHSDRIFRGAYNILLRSIDNHTSKNDHEVDVLPVILALGQTKSSY